MEAPRNIGSKTSTAPSGKSTVEMGQGVSGPDKTPDKQAQSNVMKQKVTELLMTLSVREQEVTTRVLVLCSHGSVAGEPGRGGRGAAARGRDISLRGVDVHPKRKMSHT